LITLVLFGAHIDGEPCDSKFILDAPGFNFLPSEVAAAFGLKQLDRLVGSSKGPRGDEIHRHAA
jgi:dTDP-4-amino-4,6-dideoxygalactose transaminase